ncbi:hypothetical protein [Nocardioides pinisoli]|uniref:ApeA N-terminal domain-containing protein n=1 Tax=Nocardioides pinisoli TaxID=2950279 RepID=A0ABT1KSH9_9ACTN|nr:hypothetical protein [Nocardioides pinisoli]MCP3420314.1 hypothetical protein [Nocardioides pinisoli]
MSSSGQWERIRGGVVGTFQPLSAVPQEPGSGMLKLSDEHAELTFIASDDHLDGERLPVECSAVFGETEVGDVLMLSIAQRSSSWGGFPTARYRSRCLVLDPAVDDIDGDTVIAVQLRYYGLSGWAGDRHLKDEPVVEDGRIVGWAAELRWHAGTAAPLDEGFTLRFSAGHSVTGPFDRRTLTAPLVITIESEDRRSIDEHMMRLDAVHALLAIAHRVTPTASSGGAKLSESQTGYCPLWERTMISLDPLGDTTHEFPYLKLDKFGGVEAVASWVRLVVQHRRAVEPVVRHALFSNQTPEARILSTAAAMEYWVGSNARTREWAKKRAGEDLPGALARNVDPSWLTWVGDSAQWVKEFWKAYLDLKHFRNAPADPATIHALEMSGRWLLTAVLLDHCSGSSAPSQHLFTRGLDTLGRHVREELWGTPER